MGCDCGEAVGRSVQTQLTVSPPSAAAARGTVGAARRHNGYAGTDLSMVPPSTWRSAGSSPTWRASANPCWDGLCGERCEAAGLARPDERLRHAPHLGLPQYANEPLAMSNSRACLHVRENGIGNLEMLVSWPLRIFSMSVGNDFQQPRGNQETRHFQCSACPPSTGDGLRWTSPAGPRP